MPGTHRLGWSPLSKGDRRMHRQASELQAAYLGEVRGENFFLGLAEQLPEGAA